MDDRASSVSQGNAADFVGSRIRIRFLEEPLLRTGYVLASDDRSLTISRDQLDRPILAGTAILEAIKSEILMTAVGTCQPLGSSRATILLQKSPHLKYIGFQGSFCREPIPARAKVDLVALPGLVIGVSESQFLLESSAEIPPNSSLNLTLVDSGREIEYEAFAEQCWAYGKQFRTVGSLRPATRILTMFWNKLVKTA